MEVTAMAGTGNAEKAPERIVNDHERKVPKAPSWQNGRAGVIRDLAASVAFADHDGGARTGGWSLVPLGLSDYDGPETIRFKKYATGTHVLLEEIGVETGVTHREVVRTKNKAKLYRYPSADGVANGRRRPVP